MKNDRTLATTNEIRIRSYVTITEDELADLMVEFAEIMGGGLLSITKQIKSFTDYYFKVYMTFMIDKELSGLKDAEQLHRVYFNQLNNFLTKKYISLERHENINIDEFLYEFREPLKVTLIKDSGDNHKAVELE